MVKKNFFLCLQRPQQLHRAEVRRDLFRRLLRLSGNSVTPGFRADPSGLVRQSEKISGPGDDDPAEARPRRKWLRRFAQSGKNFLTVVNVDVNPRLVGRVGFAWSF